MGITPQCHVFFVFDRLPAGSNLSSNLFAGSQNLPDYGALAGGVPGSVTDVAVVLLGTSVNCSVRSAKELRLVRANVGAVDRLRASGK